MSLASYHCSAPGYGLLDRGGSCLAFAAAMATEHSRWGKFPQLVSHHVFGDIELGKLLAVMNQESYADKLRRYRAVPRPRLNRLSTDAALLALDLRHQALIDIGTFF